MASARRDGHVPSLVVEAEVAAVKLLALRGQVQDRAHIVLGCIMLIHVRLPIVLLCRQREARGRQLVGRLWRSQPHEKGATMV